MMLTIGKIFRDLAKKDRLYKKILVLGVGKKWDEIVGEEVAERSWVEDFSDGILYVVTDDPIWLEELSFMSRQIAEKINQVLEERLVKRVVIRRVKRWKDTTRQV
ncbi:MAG: DUF721 domain-containing protein [Thermotogae bacterium]|nr:MAG: DUF721 domain-containing protein [Thermotogota bacterium]